MKDFIFYIRSNLVIIILLIVLTFLTYANILPNQLFYDDEELIYQNAYVQDIKFFPRYFSENMVAGAGKVSNMYRPLLLTSFALDHAIWGNNPIGYHLTSIILHGLNGVLVFILVKTLFANQLIALITAILFIIHPVQTEAIAYASGRTDPLFSLFTLSSLLLFLNFLSEQRKQVYKYVVSVCFFVLAILSKETAIILPLLILLAIFVKFHGKKNVRPTFVLLLIPFFAIDLIYIFLRLTILNFANTLNFYQSTNIYSQNLLVRLYTFSQVFFEYIRIILFPDDLIFARNINFLTSPFNLWVIMFLLVIAGMIVYLIKTKRKNWLVIFAFFFFFTTILPISGIIPINNIIAEHYLYLPSVSFFLLFSYLVNFLWHRYSTYQQRVYFIFLLIFIFTILTGRTILRNLDWKDPITFYTKSLSQSPWHVPMRHNLAMAYAQQGKSETAIKEYQLLITLADVYPQTHHNLANAYKAIGKYKEAETEYLKALKMDPKFFFSYYGLSDLYKITGEKGKFEELERKLQDLKLNLSK